MVHPEKVLSIKIPIVTVSNIVQIPTRTEKNITPQPKDQFGPQ